jgi:hypothetical protein
MRKVTKGTVQRLLFDDLGEEAPANGQGGDTSSTFQDNLSLPIHRWFRYSAGFSAHWVRELLERERAAGRKRILDPFVGSGTVSIEAELCQYQAIGTEPHPFVNRVARAKLNWREDPSAFHDYATAVLTRARTSKPGGDEYPKLIQTCFPPDVLQQLDALRRAWVAEADNSPLSELTWLALASILRECSPVGTAQWQYVLPRKSKARAVLPYEAFRAKVSLFAEDMAWRQRREGGPKALLYPDDARQCPSIPDGWADLIVTSPPYANNYDYADATRLEMTFFGEINGWGCLQETVRKYLVRSCTQHVSPLVKETDAILAEPVLQSIGEEIKAVCKQLKAERENHGGKKNYHTMIAAYFRDMGEVWKALRRVSARGALACLVIGDSAPYGVYVPVDRWLGQLALAAGFTSFTFEKTRDRNIKWKNRKHRVPLHEGRLWVRG